MATKKKNTGNSAENSEPKKRGHLPTLKPFPPGVSGNPAGRPPGRKMITTMIEQELAKAVKGDKEARTWLQLMVQGAIRQAVKGDIRAFDTIADRIEGKPMQAVQMSGPGGGAIQVESMSREEREKEIALLLSKAGVKHKDEK